MFLCYALNIISIVQYDNIDDIKEDLLDDEGSCIVDRMGQINEAIKVKQKEIERWIKQSINGEIDIKIKHFIFDGIRNDGKLIENTVNLLEAECLTIFRHPSAPKNDGRNKETEDVNLCIAKAIDIKNNHPILLWLVDLFGRYRMEKHEINQRNNVKV